MDISPSPSFVRALNFSFVKNQEDGNRKGEGRREREGGGVEKKKALRYSCVTQLRAARRAADLLNADRSFFFLERKHSGDPKMCRVKVHGRSISSISSISNLPR